MAANRFNDGKNEIIIVPTPSRSVLEKLHNRLSHEADSPIGSAKRGPFAALAFKPDILFVVNLSVFPSAAARSGADETIPKILRRLLGAFNRTDAVAVPDAASTAPAILAEGSLPTRSAAEAAAVAILVEFRRKAEETRELHPSSPGAGEGNCRRFVGINTSHSDLTVSAVPRHALTFLSVVFRGMGIRGLTLIGRWHFSEVYSCKDLNGQPTGRVVKVSKTASSLDCIKGGQAGTEAYAMYLGEMCALSGKRSPFVRVMLELILLAVPAEHDNQYVSVLFMEEGVQTVKEDVLRLAAGIQLLDGSFSQPGLRPPSIVGC